MDKSDHRSKLVKLGDDPHLDVLLDEPGWDGDGGGPLFFHHVAATPAQTAARRGAAARRRLLWYGLAFISMIAPLITLAFGVLLETMRAPRPILQRSRVLHAVWAPRPVVSPRPADAPALDGEPESSVPPIGDIGADDDPLDQDTARSRAAAAPAGGRYDRWPAGRRALAGRAPGASPVGSMTQAPPKIIE